MKLHLYKNLMNNLSLSRNQIERYAKNAPNEYKIYTIPKKSTGERTIAHPSKKVKELQRTVAKIFEENIQPHCKAIAYKKGGSIKVNANLHSNNSYILKMDFVDFFNSITPNMFIDSCNQKGYEFSTAENRLLSRILFWNKSKFQNGKLVLSVGAPSSPIVSNLTMYDFDDYFDKFCLNREITYSRYADDITFSTQKKDILFSLPNEVRNFLFKYYSNNITVNEHKTVFSSKAHNRHITGITLTNDNKLSIGRQRKRMISSLVHKYKLNILEPDMINYLQGMLSFAINIEPELKIRLIAKYSAETIDSILKIAIINGE